MLFVFEAADDNLMTKKNLENIHDIETRVTNDANWDKYCVLQYPSDSILDNTGNNATYEATLAQKSTATGCRPAMTVTNIFYGNFSALDFVADFDDSIFDNDKFQMIADILSESANPMMFQTLLFRAMAESGDAAGAKAIYDQMVKLFGLIPQFDGKKEEINDVDATLKIIASMRKFPLLRTFSLQDFFIDKNFDVDNLKSKYLRGQTFFGYPLTGYDNRTDERFVQDNEYGV